MNKVEDRQEDSLKYLLVNLKYQESVYTNRKPPQLAVKLHSCEYCSCRAPIHYEVLATDSFLEASLMSVKPVWKIRATYEVIENKIIQLCAVNRVLNNAKSNVTINGECR